jgi:hypothetical protein
VRSSENVVSAKIPSLFANKLTLRGSGGEKFAKPKNLLSLLFGLVFPGVAATIDCQPKS